MFTGGQICDDDSCTAFKSITCKDNSVKLDDDGSGDDGDIAQQGSDGEPVQESVPPPTVQKIGGQLMGELSATTNSFPSGSPIAVFGRGTDNVLWWQYGNGTGKWSGWQQIGGEMKYSPSCATFQNAIHCFVVGSDNALWTTQQDKKGAGIPSRSSVVSQPVAFCSGCQ